MREFAVRVLFKIANYVFVAASAEVIRNISRLCRPNDRREKQHRAFLLCCCCRLKRVFNELVVTPVKGVSRLKPNDDIVVPVFDGLFANCWRHAVVFEVEVYNGIHRGDLSSYVITVGVMIAEILHVRVVVVGGSQYLLHFLFQVRQINTLHV